jgi:DsbC/DsbD-like thiol-disulfide interchange protein
MRSLLFFFLVLLSLDPVMAQIQDPVHWNATYKSINDTEGEIVVSAKIDKGWHTYSQRPTDAGPIPTSFKFAPAAEYELIGGTVESDAHEEFVKAFEANIFVFSEKAQFTQKVKIRSKAPASIKFKVEYMSCNDLMCLPPKTTELSVKVQ